MTAADLVDPMRRFRPAPLPENAAADEQDDEDEEQHLHAAGTRVVTEQRVNHLAQGRPVGDQPGGIPQRRSEGRLQFVQVPPHRRVRDPHPPRGAGQAALAQDG